MAATRSEVLSLYKELMRTGKQFGSYNFREYAKRRVRDAFKEHKSESDSEKIKQFISKAQENLAIMRRQVSLGQMYQQQKLVIEKKLN